MTTVILVRHGYSTANKDGIFAGNYDADLDEKGILQALKTAKYISENYKVDKVYASDLKRAYKTGVAIADETGTEIIPDNRLREINAGKWDGVLFDSLDKLFPEDFSVWQEDISNAKCTDGESVKELAERVMGAVTEMAEKNDEKVIVIASHATPIRVFECLVKTGDLTRLNEINWVSNASISVYTCDKNIWSANQISFDEHLKDIRTTLPVSV